MLRAILEVYPPDHPNAGQLRYRQVLVSVARQSGKSTLAAALALWGMLRKRGGLTLGVAKSIEHANIVFGETRKMINANPELRALFKRVTSTRGLEMHNDARYLVRPANSDALQGFAITTGICDEVHLVSSDLWGAMVSGTGARAGTLIAGITTAGDEKSELLSTLYANAEKSAAGDPSFSRFGAWIWESPEARVPDDDAELLELLKPANPRLSSGFLDPADVLADVRSQSNAEIVRYRLNRFHTSTDHFVDMRRWADCQRPLGAEWPTGTPVFAIDISPNKEYATIAAAVLDAAGIAHTELVRWIVQPNHEALVRECELLARHAPAAFIVENKTGRELGNELKRRGRPVSYYGPDDMVRAEQSFYSRVQRGTLQHAGDKLLSVQLPHTVRKAVGEDMRISRQLSSSEIDGVLSTVMSVHGCEVTPRKTPRVFTV